MIVEYFIHMGKSDVLPASEFTENTEVKRIDLIDNLGALGHGIDQVLGKLFALNVASSETAVDLLNLASMVFAADTSLDRRKLTEDGWTRQFRLFFPVHDPDLWASNSAHLERMLKFLTGDFWEFRFRGRPAEYKTLVKKPEELNLSNFDAVSLFSGGLDSLVGAIDLLEQGKNPLFVSHSKDIYASSAQKSLGYSFEKKYSEKTYDVLRAPIGVTLNNLKSAGTDGNQRARSFLFYSMAAVAADALESVDTVLIPENGLIALNVPLEPFRLGSLSTRTAHPFFINCMGELSKNLGIRTGFENPYRFKTKGEMVSECTNLTFLQSVTAYSMSCSAPGKDRWSNGVSNQHCGYCVPCLIRRASLERGLGIDDPTIYTLDELAQKFDSRKKTGENIRSFKLAIDHARKHPESWRYLVRKTGPLSSSDVEEYANMYGRGMAEVGELLKHAVAGHD